MELKIRSLLFIILLVFQAFPAQAEEKPNKFPDALVKKIQEAEGMDVDYIEELAKVLDAVGVPLTGPFDNPEDIYKNYTNVTLGDNKYRIPKAYVRPFAVTDEYDGDDISRNGEVTVLIEYVLPDKHSSLEHLFVRDEKIEQAIHAGNLVSLSMLDPREEFNQEKYNEVFNKRCTPVPEEDKAGLYACEGYYRDRITYFDISEGNIVDVINCEPDPEKPETEPDCKDVMKNFGKAKKADRLFCSKIDAIREPPECDHVFFRNNVFHMLKWSSSHFQEWKDMKNQALEFVDRFKVEP